VDLESDELDMAQNEVSRVQNGDLPYLSEDEMRNLVRKYLREGKDTDYIFVPDFQDELLERIIEEERAHMFTALGLKRREI